MMVTYWYKDNCCNKFGPFTCDMADFRQFLRNSYFKEEVLTCYVYVEYDSIYKYQFPVGWSISNPEEDLGQWLKIEEG